MYINESYYLNPHIDENLHVYRHDNEDLANDWHSLECQFYELIKKFIDTTMNVSSRTESDINLYNDFLTIEETIKNKRWFKEDIYELNKKFLKRMSLVWRQTNAVTFDDMLDAFYSAICRARGYEEVSREVFNSLLE